MTALQQARAAADKGIASSIAHAGPEWADAALVMVRFFARVQDRKWEQAVRNWGMVPKHIGSFTMEQCRIWAAAHDLPDPPDARCWGSVTRRALSEGLIVRTGEYQATAASNGGLKALYRKA